MATQPNIVNRRLTRSLSTILLPLIVIIVTGIVGLAVWSTRAVAVPPRAPFITTPEKYGILSERGAKVTEETWANRDGSQARGWLLRGTENAPAVILLHSYGADRSSMLNLGVKLNEASNYTILMPDLRGHGQQPPINYTSFGGCEIEDFAAAIAYLRGLKADSTKPLVGRDIGVYGSELGGYVALAGASREQVVTTIVVDSVPSKPDGLLRSIIKPAAPFAANLTASLASSIGTSLYFRGCYDDTEICSFAKNISNRRVLLLSTHETENPWNASTVNLQKCLGKQLELQLKNDLTVSGYNLRKASSEAADIYERMVIDFFVASLGGKAMPNGASVAPADINPASVNAVPSPTAEPQPTPSADSVPNTAPTENAPANSN